MAAAPRSTSSSWFHSRLFQSRFRLPSCKSAKIMTDARTGQSRGYGFVRFSDESDRRWALGEMQGSGRVAENKDTTTFGWGLDDGH